jgi:hypothetical protein
MLRKLMFMAVIAIFPLFFASSAAADDLVTFNRNYIPDALRCCHIRVMAKIDSMAIGLLPPGQYDLMKGIITDSRLVENNTNIDLLWIASSDENSAAPALYETEHFKLIKVDNNQAQMLLSSGISMRKCLDLNLPADPGFEIPPRINISNILLTDIDSLMELVSVDSIYSYLERLQEFQTRYTNTDSFWAASQWIHDKFQAWGYDSLEFQNFGWAESQSCNVIATKVGQIYPDEVVVIGGHFDSVVYDGGDPTIYAPGVDDNATGAVMTMEIARVLANTPLKRTVRFVTFGAEEQGLIGSQIYVTYALQRNENIELMINADMIGNVGDAYYDFIAGCNARGLPFANILANIAESHTTLIPYIQINQSFSSDQMSFDNAGFRVIYSTENDFSPNWHRQSDILDNINVVYAGNIIRCNLGLLLIAIDLPSPVSGLMAANAGDGNSVYLEWESSSDEDIIGYEVYSGLSPSTVSIIDTTTVIADTIRGLQDGTRYYFGVATIASDGSRSVIDEIVSATPRIRPTRPDTLIVTPEFGRIMIEWTLSPDRDFHYYQLYRRVGGNGEFQPYQNVTAGPEYIDQGLQSNTRYYYYVTSVDTTGLESESSNTDYAKLLSLDSGILFVDETRDGSGSQGQPDSAQQDSFYNYITSQYRVTKHDTQYDGLLRINDFGAYSTVVWVDDDASGHALADIDQDLARYLDIGGNLFFTGWRAFYSYNNGRPFSFQAGAFPYDYLHIGSVYSTNIKDFTGATGMTGWPNLSVLPERTLPSWNGRLLGVDVMGPFDLLDTIYTFNSVSGDTLLQGKPVGIVRQGPNYKAVYFTFPLLVMPDDSVRIVFNKVMEFFGEQTDIKPDNEENILPSGIFLAQNYPNPFNGITKISFSLSKPGKIHLGIYNILGQEISILFDGQFQAGNYVTEWDSKEMTSGIYFYRLSTSSGSISQRMVLLK